MRERSAADEIWMIMSPFLDSFETLGNRLFPEWHLSTEIESHAAGFHSVTIGDSEVMLTLTVQDRKANLERLHVHKRPEKAAENSRESGQESRREEDRT